MAETAYGQVALTLVATLLALAIIEHWFLVLPIEDAALWRWALGAKGKSKSNASIRSNSTHGRSSVKPIDGIAVKLVKQN